jgi:ferredoxin
VSGAEPARLRVDPISCHAHGLCAELLPELVRLDEWDYPIIDDPAVPPSIRAQARAAVAACPTLALRLEQGRPGQARAARFASAPTELLPPPGRDPSRSPRRYRRRRLLLVVLSTLAVLALLPAGPVADHSWIGGGSVVGEAPPDPGDDPALDRATGPEPLWPTPPPNIESDD